MPNELEFEPGWLRQDMERASQRVEEWSKGPLFRSASDCERAEATDAGTAENQSKLALTLK